MRRSRLKRRASVRNGGELKLRRGTVRPFPPLSTKSTLPPSHKRVRRTRRSMASWKPRLEARARVIADGDEVNMEKLMLIISWFAEERDLKEVAGAAYRKHTEAEDWRLTPLGEPVGVLRILLWAMEEAASDDPKQSMKWKAFQSRCRAPAGPSEFVVGEVMGLPTPVPATAREAREDLGSDKAKEGTKPGAKKKKMSLILRRSPRFPRRSPHLLSLARSQGRW
ncbi:hypothetical protein VPH35_042951 [Triticum aestivum]